MTYTTVGPEKEEGKPSLLHDQNNVDNTDSTVMKK